MKADRFKKCCITFGLVFLSITLFSAEAFPWGFATHTYIADHIGRQNGIRNADEIYGALAPDIFAYAIELPYWQEIYFDTHFDYVKLWNAGKNGVERSLAFGFASHNNLWGADASAHSQCFTCGEPDGYAIAKARQVLAAAPLPPEVGIPDDVAVEIIHELVENGVDLLVKRGHPLIGQKISKSAMLRSPQFPSVIADAYAADLSALSGLSYPEAEDFITAAEGEFRRSVVFYGQVLTFDEETALAMMSAQTARLAGEFLALSGIELPLPEEAVVELVTVYTRLAISLCESDYLQEIDATITHVDEQMRAQGIVY